MRQFILALGILALGSQASYAQFNLDKFKNKAKEALGASTGLSQEDAASGLKEALIQGVGKGTSIVSKLDGYFGNPQIKIPLPSDAQKIESKLRAVGMGRQVDDAILSLNRAAEDAASEAKPIFVDAIRGMTVQDAVSIVRGTDRAGTDYLQRTTNTQLSSKFSPIISRSLEKVNATRYWSDMVSSYNKIPFVEKLNPNLTEYVTQKAIDGLFVMVAQEELNIRRDPAARVSDILKKVFGSRQ